MGRRNKASLPGGFNGPTVGSLRRRLARRSLKPQLNQIRTWVRQGRTDAWIAHQLDVSVGDIRSFKREHELAPADAGEGENFVPGAETDEPDLRAEDDALVAEALEAERQAEAEAEPRGRRRTTARATTARATAGTTATTTSPKRRRRGRRGGRGAAAAAQAEAARGHVRPRRGGLRPVARPRRAGRPDLRRALGRPPPGDRDDRARPDRHQPRRRGSRRRRRRRGLTDGLRGRERPLPVARGRAPHRESRPSRPRPTSRRPPTWSWRRCGAGSARASWWTSWPSCTREDTDWALEIAGRNRAGTDAASGGGRRLRPLRPRGEGLRRRPAAREAREARVGLSAAAAKAVVCPPLAAAPESAGTASGASPC